MGLRRRHRRAVLAAGVLAAIAWGTIECNVLVIVRARIRLGDLPAGSAVRVVHLSDVHDKVFWDGNEGLFRDIRAFAPRAIVITGDLVNANSPHFLHAYELVARLTAIAPRTFYVPGNHEHGTGRLVKLLRGLTERGVVVLRNQWVPFTASPGLELAIIGVDDACSGHDDIALATRKLETGRCAVMITHAPEVVSRLDSAPVDLVLAGHTHGGQVRLPVVGALYAPGQGFFPRWSRGLYNLGGGRQLYVDSGLGTSDLPLRYFTPAQVSFLELVSAQ